MQAMNISDFENITFLVDDRSSCVGGNESEYEKADYSLSSIVLLSVLTGLFCLVGLTGNVAVVVVILKDRVISQHLQHLYLLSLAVADVLLVVSVVPFSLTNELLGYWPFGEVYCRIYLTVDVLLCTASICNICLIGLDRYVSVNYPTTYKRFRTITRIRFGIMFMWIYALSVSLLPFFSHTQLIDGSIQQGCFINDSSWYIIVSCCLSFFLPACIICPVYIKIYSIGKQLQARRQSRHTLRDMDLSETRMQRHSINPQNGTTLPIITKGLWRTNMTLKPRNEDDTDHSNKSKRCDQQIIKPLETNKLASNSSSESLPAKLGDSKDTKKENRRYSIPVRAEPSNSNADEFHGMITVTFSPNLPVTETAIFDTTKLGDNSVSHREAIYCYGDLYPDHAFSASTLASRNVSNISQGDIPRSKNVCWFRACCAKFCSIERKYTIQAKPNNNVGFEVISNRSEFSETAMGAKRRLQSITSMISSKKLGEDRRFSSMSTQSCNASLRENRFVFIICIVTGCFIISWAPFFVTYFLYAICRTCCIDKLAFKVFFWLGYLNSAVNPILYTIFNKEFRKAFKNLFQRSRSNW